MSILLALILIAILLAVPGLFRLMVDLGVLALLICAAGIALLFGVSWLAQQDELWSALADPTFWGCAVIIGSIIALRYMARNND